MKKTLIFLSKLLFISLSFSQTLKAADKKEIVTITVINGETDENIKGVLRENELFVPLKDAAQKLGYKVSWEQKVRSAILEKDGEKISFNIDKKEAAFKKGSKKIPSFIDKGRTYVNKDFFTSALGLYTEIKNYGDNSSEYKVLLIGKYSNAGDKVKDGSKRIKFSAGNIEFSLDMTDEDLKMISYSVDEKNKNMINFYDRYSKENVESCKDAALIASISKNGNLESYMMPGIALDLKDENFVEAIFASDVQYDNSNKISKDAYRKASERFKEILKTFKLIK